MNTWKKFSEEEPTIGRNIWISYEGCSPIAMCYRSHNAPMVVGRCLWTDVEPPPPLPKEEAKCPHCKRNAVITVCEEWKYGAMTVPVSDLRDTFARCLDCGARGPYCKNSDEALKAFCEVGK